MRNQSIAYAVYLAGNIGITRKI